MNVGDITKCVMDEWQNDTDIRWANTIASITNLNET